MSIYGERFDIKVYRANELVFDDNGEVISFNIERTITTERTEARLRFDGSTISPTSIKANDALEIWIASPGLTLTKVFAGEIETATNIREEGEPYLDVVAFDWSKLLGERKVNLSYPIVTNGSTIVKEIVSLITSAEEIQPNERKISVDNVETISKTRTIDFIGLTMFEALQKLSEYTLCDFYIDEVKDLHWFLRGSKNSGVTLTEDDLQTYDYVVDRSVINHCKVFGAPTRTEPLWNLDQWSGDLNGWYSEAEGAGATIEVTKTASTFTASGIPGWIRNQAWANLTQEITVVTFSGDLSEWTTVGSSPWLNTPLESSHYIKAGTGDDGKKMTKWSFQPPDIKYVNIKNLNSVKLKFQVQFGSTWPTVWESDCEDFSKFSSTDGNVEIVGTGESGNCLKVTGTGACNFGRAEKTFVFGTGNIYAYFYLYLPSATHYQEGDVIEVARISDSKYGTTRAQCYIKKVGNGWRWYLRGWDKDGVSWDLGGGPSASSGVWTSYCLNLKKAGSNLASASLIRGGTNLITKAGINLTGKKVKTVAFEGVWSHIVEVAPSIFYDTLSIVATKQTTNLNAWLWKESSSNFVMNQFSVDDSDYDDWKTKEIDVTSTLSSYEDLQNVKLYLEVGSQVGIGEADGYALITYVEIDIDADYYYGEGSPYISDDDGDEDFIETNIENREDYSWKEFDVSLEKMALHLETKIYVKGRNIEGTDTVGCKLFVKDASTGSWVNLGEQTWGPSETSFTYKIFDASNYLKTRYNIENQEWKFVKTGATSTLRITYAYLYVKYVEATSIMELDYNVKKTGEASIWLHWLGDPGTGTLETKMWKVFDEPIICQTTEMKEGLITLAFAALVDMFVWSNLDHWKRPEAVLDEFTLNLYDSSNNVVRYTAGNLYPENRFTAIPGPNPRVMKEIRMAVGENAEAEGKWERIVGISFDWTSVSKIEFTIRGITDIEVEGNPYLSDVELWIDWLHFEEGRWFGEYILPEDNEYVLTYGRSYSELFDKTCFSNVDCEIRAKYYVEKHKIPMDRLESVEIDYIGMEVLRPGEIVTFELPEGTLTLRITEINWVWDGDLYGQLELDNEGFQIITGCPSGEQIENSGFETGTFPPWETTGDAGIDSYEHHSGNYCAYGSDSAVIKQTLASIIEGSCFSNASTYLKGYYDFCQWAGTVLTIKVYYEDETFNSLTHETTEGESNNWILIDFLSIINTSKNVKRIEFILDATSIHVCFIDDISMEC